ncbi:MAG: HD domain-containing protein [Dehalococcoidia bacterium]|nr:HD domain-containing protein [Dehalococcoidia bacterium]
MTDATTQFSMGLGDTVEALTQTMIVWDDANYRHCERTSAYAVRIARELGLDEETVEQTRIGALLHDIGKIGVDLTVLRKPAELDAAETEHVRLHPGMGAAILERVLPAAAVACAAAHHEQPDGHGYPRGLREPEIPPGALICRVADVLDSLTTDQAYRPALTLAAALDELRSGAGSRYSAAVVEALLRAIGDEDRLAA